MPFIDDSLLGDIGIDIVRGSPLPGGEGDDEVYPFGHIRGLKKGGWSPT